MNRPTAQSPRGGGPGESTRSRTPSTRTRHDAGGTQRSRGDASHLSDARRDARSRVDSTGRRVARHARPSHSGLALAVVAAVRGQYRLGREAPTRAPCRDRGCRAGRRRSTAPGAPQESSRRPVLARHLGRRCARSRQRADVRCVGSRRPLGVCGGVRRCDRGHRDGLRPRLAGRPVPDGQAGAQRCGRGVPVLVNHEPLDLSRTKRRTGTDGVVLDAGRSWAMRSGSRSLRRHSLLSLARAHSSPSREA